jgi:hypothetical protein
MGSHFCVFPHKLIPQRRLHIHYLCAANSTTIHTYRWLPLASIWDYARNTHIAICNGPCHTTPHHRTPTSNFQHLWHQTSLYGSRNKFQAPPSPHTATHLPDNYDSTFQPLNAYKCSSQHHRLQLPEPRVLVVTATSPHISAPKQPFPCVGVMWGTSHMSNNRQMPVAMQRLV